MIVQYLGRGHEHFFDEIQNLFTWMGSAQTRLLPQKVRGRSRCGLGIIFSGGWRRATRRNQRDSAGRVGRKPGSSQKAPSREDEAGPLAPNGVWVKSGSCGKVTVWLSPELVKFDRTLNVTINGKPQRATNSAEARDAARRCPHPRRSAASVLGEGGKLALFVRTLVRRSARRCGGRCLRSRLRVFGCRWVVLHLEGVLGRFGGELGFGVERADSQMERALGVSRSDDELDVVGPAAGRCRGASGLRRWDPRRRRASPGG